MSGWSVETGRQPRGQCGTHSFLSALRREGVAEASLLAGTGFTADDVANPSRPMSKAGRLILFDNARRLCGRSDAALRAGAGRSLGDFGIYGYGISCHRSLAEGMVFGLRNIRLMSPLTQIHHRWEGRGTLVLSSESGDLGELYAFVLEYWRGSVSALLSNVLQAPIKTRRMLCAYAPPAHWREYERIFGCPVEFDADVNEWHLDAELLARLLPNANDATARMCENVCATIVQAPPRSETLVDRVRELCMRSPGLYPSATEMAERLKISVRSMFRRLAAEGLSYQDVLDDVRRERAETFLRDDGLTVDEIAFRVGFSEATNFRKAFRRWVGTTPSDYRRRMLAPGSSVLAH